MLTGRVAERTQDLIREICESRDVAIVRGAVTEDSKSQCRLSEDGAASAEIWSGFSRVLRLSVACQPHRLEPVVV